jgi:hypothetical protein
MAQVRIPIWFCAKRATTSSINDRLTRHCNGVKIELMRDYLYSEIGNLNLVGRRIFLPRRDTLETTSSCRDSPGVGEQE